MGAHNSGIGMTKLDRYRIAQQYHEMTQKVEAPDAVNLLSRHHGVAVEDILAFAAEFPVEPLWRL